MQKRNSGCPQRSGRRSVPWLAHGHSAFSQQGVAEPLKGFAAAPLVVRPLWCGITACASNAKLRCAL